MIFITKFDSNEKWTDTGVDAFIAVILFQSWTLLLVSIGGVIIKICGFCKWKKKQPEQSDTEESESQNMSKVENSNTLDDISRDQYKNNRMTLPRVVFYYTQSEEISKEESKYSHSQISLKISKILVIIQSMLKIRKYI